MIENFYEQVIKELEKNHVLIFVDIKNEKRMKEEIENMFTYLEDYIQDQMNNLEAITHNKKYICVRRILNTMPKVANPGFTLMFLPIRE